MRNHKPIITVLISKIQKKPQKSNNPTPPKKPKPTLNISKQAEGEKLIKLKIKNRKATKNNRSFENINRIDKSLERLIKKIIHKLVISDTKKDVSLQILQTSKRY